ncbi:MAG TPA: serpin family protein [Candidatus Ventrimonas merdavium]|nr:serpin family protein [Candidatus Ventrimonas merdavium]
MKKSSIRTTRTRRRPAAAALSALTVLTLLTGCAGAAQQGSPTTSQGGQITQQGGSTISQENQTGQAAPQSGTQPLSEDGFSLAEAVYPASVTHPDEADYTDPATGEFDSDGYFEEFDAWQQARLERTRLTEEEDRAVDGFARDSIRQFLSETEGENRVYSPVNVYLALAMLAETTDGVSRQQVLDALGLERIEDLRTTAADLWNTCYVDDGTVTCRLANSMWLQVGLEYNQETVERLAREYFASSYQGLMGSPEYDKKLQTWLDEQTGGLLKEEASGIELSLETVLALASTIYYKASWTSEFMEDQTKEEVFHGTQGDQRHPFLHNSSQQLYYEGEQFTAAALGLNNSGSMWLFLPEEGTAPEELLQGDEIYEALFAPDKGDKWKPMMVNLSMPKFDVVSDLDLRDGLMELGIQDVFDKEIADFSPLTQAVEEIFLSQAKHAARVTVDEKGVEAAAYTVLMMEAGGSMMPEAVDFVLDRPFLFVITSEDGLPLFAGVVNQLG